MPPDNGFPQISVPQPAAGIPGGTPGAQPTPQPPAMPPMPKPQGQAPAAPQSQNQPMPQPTPAPPTDQDQFNVDHLLSRVGTSSDGPDQYSKDPNAVGSAGQIAQAHIGRNANEQLQIWGKLVGSNNTRIGPDNNVWIRGDDKQFHPADTGHTNFLQDVSKWSGAGIDMTAMALSEIAGTAIGGGTGAAIGALGGGGVGAVPGAAVGAKVGSIVGLMAGPAIGSASREYLEKLWYDVKPDKEQFKRDAIIGGALNTVMGGLFSGLGPLTPAALTGGAIENGLVGSVVKKFTTAGADSASARIQQVAKAQASAKNFFDTLGVKPASLGEGGIDTPMADAGNQVKTFAQGLRSELSDSIQTARQKIIAASPAKPDLSSLADYTQGFLKRAGMSFDENGMPIPFKTHDIYSANPEVALPVGTVSESSIKSPLGSRGGEGVLNEMSEDYKAMKSGQMSMEDFMNKIQTWQDDAKFKVFDNRSSSERSAWAQLQHQAVDVRNSEINQRLADDPVSLKFIKDSYSNYRSKIDATDMFLDKVSKSQGSDEALANSLVGPGKDYVLGQYKALTADRAPHLFDNLKASWLSQKMGEHMNDEGIFDAVNFRKDLQNLGPANLKILFTPQELGQVNRSAMVMNRVKTNDLFTPASGDSVSQMAADMIKQGQKLDISKPSSLLNFFRNKPSYAEYVADYGLPKIAAQTSDIDQATAMNKAGTALKNFLMSQRLGKNVGMREAMATSMIPNARQLSMKAMTDTQMGRQMTGALGGDAVNQKYQTNPTAPGETPGQAGSLNNLGGR